MMRSLEGYVTRRPSADMENANHGIEIGNVELAAGALLRIVRVWPVSKSRRTILTGEEYENSERELGLKTPSKAKRPLALRRPWGTALVALNRPVALVLSAEVLPVRK